MTQSEFKINDYRLRYCKNCGREIQHGETVKRGALHRIRNDEIKGKLVAKTRYTCQDCYRTGTGERIIT